jgi:hypothetical protein
MTLADRCEECGNEFIDYLQVGHVIPGDVYMRQLCNVCVIETLGPEWHRQ